jgi:hypothetical protein
MMTGLLVSRSAAGVDVVSPPSLEAEQPLKANTAVTATATAPRPTDLRLSISVLL